MDGLNIILIPVLLRVPLEILSPGPRIFITSLELRMILKNI